MIYEFQPNGNLRFLNHWIASTSLSNNKNITIITKNIPLSLPSISIIKKLLIDKSQNNRPGTYDTQSHKSHSTVKKSKSQEVTIRKLQIDHSKFIKSSMEEILINKFQSSTDKMREFPTYCVDQYQP
ncbi:unnamed protein product [Paramecium octaurelia]|uniref:Uncharacterized protein n=1 Tax=Paramecium octaurelia TaxID=43137 RepID=A0A8S1XIF6_PAROT|nr:unnamed protein product [Paramecium octaurelia]